MTDIINRNHKQTTQSICCSIQSSIPTIPIQSPPARAASPIDTPTAAAPPAVAAAGAADEDVDEVLPLVLPVVLELDVDEVPDPVAISLAAL